MNNLVYMCAGSPATMILEIYHGTYHLCIVGTFLEAARFDLVLEHRHIINHE